MTKELDSLKKEIEGALAEGGFVVFHGRTRIDEPLPAILWDVDQYPDPAMFLAVASKLDTKLIVFHHRTFKTTLVEQARRRLDDADIPAEDYAEYTRTLKRLAQYEGFICALEMSFDVEATSYVYETITPWYAEFLSMIDDLSERADADTETDDVDDDDDPMGGYYSQN